MTVCLSNSTVSCLKQQVKYINAICTVLTVDDFSARHVLSVIKAHLPDLAVSSVTKPSQTSTPFFAYHQAPPVCHFFPFSAYHVRDVLRLLL